MRKLVFLILSVLILAGQSTAQTWYSWRYRYHATDCTSITDGKETDLCYEVDSQVLYKCVPSIGACDTVGEWKRIEAVEADPIVKAITGIVKSNGTTISAAVAGTDYQTPLTADTHYLTPTTAASTYQPLGSYLTSESDPKISTLTSGKWCTTNGSVITCNVDPVTDTNTTYSASGTLLQLIGTAFSVDEGTLTNGKGCKFVSGTGLVCDQDYLTSVASDSTWTGHNSYPAACSAGQYVSAIGDTLTCSAPTDNNTTYTASGSLLQLSSTAFSLKEGTLTNGKFCTYSTTSGLVCNSDANNYSLPTATDSVLGGIKVGSGLSITEGVLSATGGGYTNLTSFEDQTAWRLFYSDADGDVTELALGSDGEYLKSNGASVAPSWGTPTGGAHDAVTLAGQDYLSLSTQEITANLINGDNINWDTIENISDSNINWTDFDVPSDAINSDDIKDRTIAGVDLATNIAITSTGAQDFGGASSFEITNSADPDIDALGEISYDSDDFSIRAFDGTNQFVVGKKTHQISKTLYKPNDMDNKGYIVLWKNLSAFVYNISRIWADSDTDDVDFSLIAIGGSADGLNWDDVVEIEPFTVDTDSLEAGGVNWFSGDILAAEGINWTEIGPEDAIGVNWTEVDAPDLLHLEIEGWFNADVN